MYNLTVDHAHTFYVGADHLLVHNSCKIVNGESYTEPTLPPRVIVEENGVQITHNYFSNDHGPAHLHVEEIGNPRSETKIGRYGVPIDGENALTPRERSVVANNKAAIRSAVNKIGRWLAYNDLIPNK